MGWTAGKWREWYPDVAVGESGGAATARMHTEGRQFELTTEQPKFMWQSGWWAQHQRLLAMLTSQPRRAAVVCSGDLHASGHARIQASGDLSLQDNPLHTILTGPVGTGRAWPSATRGTPPVIPHGLELEPVTPVIEKNGFTLLDVKPNCIRVRLFAWRSGEPVERIDTLEPYHDVEIAGRT